MIHEYKTYHHHLWGKSERAIFAIITSLLLPIFTCNYQSTNEGEGKILRRHPPRLEVSSNDL